MNRGPQRNSRKGRMLALQYTIADLVRDWRCHTGKWQPSTQLIATTRLRITRVRKALDELEAKL